MANELFYRLIVSDFHRPWTPITLEASQIPSPPLGGSGRGWGVGFRYPQPLVKISTSAVLLAGSRFFMRPSRPIHVEAWFPHGENTFSIVLLGSPTDFEIDDK